MAYTLMMSEITLGVQESKVERAIRLFHHTNRNQNNIFSEALNLMGEDNERKLTPYENVIGHYSLFLESLADFALKTRVVAREKLGNEIVNDIIKIAKISKSETKKAAQEFEPLSSDINKIYKYFKESCNNILR